MFEDDFDHFIAFFIAYINKESEGNVLGFGCIVDEARAKEGNKQRGLPGV